MLKLLNHKIIQTEERKHWFKQSKIHAHIKV